MPLDREPVGETRHLIDDDAAARGIRDRRLEVLGVQPVQMLGTLPQRRREALQDAALLLAAIEEVVEALPTELKERLAGVTSISEADNRLDQMMLDAARKALKETGRPVARAFAYLVARDGEMRRLIAIVKGRRLGLPTDLVRFAANLESA